VSTEFAWWLGGGREDEERGREDEGKREATLLNMEEVWGLTGNVRPLEKMS
jgi:hypothetical protein